MKEACAHPPCSVCSVCILKENVNGMQVQVTLAVSWVKLAIGKLYVTFFA